MKTSMKDDLLYSLLTNLYLNVNLEDQLWRILHYLFINKTVNGFWANRRSMQLVFIGFHVLYYEVVQKNTSSPKTNDSTMKNRQYQTKARTLFLPVIIICGGCNTNKENEKMLLLTRHAWVIYQIFMGDGGSKTERRHCIKSSQQGGTCERKACHRYGTTS